VKIVLKFVLATAIAAGLAAWSVSAALNRPGRSIRNGPWTTSLTVGSAGAGLYERARIAAHGLWALDSSEVIYYTAMTDSQGRPLEHGATYRIEGSDPDTRWWSITAYNNDHFIPNPLDRYSYSKTTVTRRADGGWVITLARERAEPNWLPAGEEPGTLVLTLRCYNPGTKLAADPAGIALPTITREDAP
jgi:hypothetical protein